MGRLIPIALAITFLVVAACRTNLSSPGSGAVSAGLAPDLPLTIGPGADPGKIGVAPLANVHDRSARKLTASRDLILRRSPRDSAPATYRIGPGVSFFATPTADPRWLKVDLTKKRSAYVRTDQASAALALALAQGKIADKARLSPKPRHGNEPDIGDGSAGEPGVRDAAVTEAIERIESSFDEAEVANDQFKADVAAFKGEAASWPAAKAAAIQSADALNVSLGELAQAIQGLAANSGSLSGNDRNAFQGLSNAHGDAQDALQLARNALGQMTEGSDWTELIAVLEDHQRRVESALNAFRTSLNRL